MTNREFEAGRVRAMQSGLMFAALKCIHKPHLYLQDKYNQIMRQYSKDLAAHSIVVQQYFRRTHGLSHRRDLRKYVTGMANQYSLNSFSEPEFCEGMSALGASVLEAGDDAVSAARFSREMLLPSIAKQCKPADDLSSMLLDPTVPDLVSIHMPDIDIRLRARTHANY